MMDIGGRLRQARELRGLSLGDIAGTTKISITALRDIEDNNFSTLPGGVFRRAYVKSFAVEVGVNPEEVVAEIRARFDSDPGSLSVLISSHRRDLRAARALLAATAVLLLSAALVAGVFAFLQDAPGAEPSPAASATPTAVALANRPDERGDFARTAGAVADRPSLRLEIRASGPFWVSVVADGTRALHRFMQPGERALIEATRAIDLDVGDAGAFAYSINGILGRRLGDEGRAVSVQLTNDNYTGFLVETPEIGDLPPGASIATTTT